VQGRSVPGLFDRHVGDREVDGHALSAARPGTEQVRRYPIPEGRLAKSKQKVMPIGHQQLPRDFGCDRGDVADPTHAAAEHLGDEAGRRRFDCGGEPLLVAAV